MFSVCIVWLQWRDCGAYFPVITAYEQLLSCKTCLQGQCNNEANTLVGRNSRAVQELPALCSFLSTLTNGPEKTGNQSLTSKNRDLKMFREKKKISKQMTTLQQ